MGATLLSVNDGKLKFESVKNNDGVIKGYNIKNICIDGSRSIDLEFKEASLSAFKIIETK
jgi:hypothetical protein